TAAAAEGFVVVQGAVAADGESAADHGTEEVGAAGEFDIGRRGVNVGVNVRAAAERNGGIGFGVADVEVGGDAARLADASRVNVAVDDELHRSAGGVDVHDTCTDELHVAIDVNGTGAVDGADGACRLAPALEIIHIW